MAKKNNVLQLRQQKSAVAEVEDQDLEDLRGFVWNDQKASNRDWRRLAADAKVSYSTVRSFASGQTKRPHFLTILKLVRAMDMRIAIVPQSLPLMRDEVNLRKYRQRSKR